MALCFYVREPSFVNESPECGVIEIIDMTWLGQLVRIRMLNPEPDLALMAYNQFVSSSDNLSDPPKSDVPQVCRRNSDMAVSAAHRGNIAAITWHNWSKT